MAERDTRCLTVLDLWHQEYGSAVGSHRHDRASLDSDPVLGTPQRWVTIDARGDAGSDAAAVVDEDLSVGPRIALDAVPGEPNGFCNRW